MALPKSIASLRNKISKIEDPDVRIDMLPRLAVIELGDLFGLDYYGYNYEFPYEDLMATIAQKDVAERLRFLVLRGPDEGANGTNNWDLEPMLAKGAVFENLEELSIQLTAPGDHNASIVGSSYEEEGVLSRVLKASPNLKSLTAPSAPNSEFFKVGERPLEMLNIDAGYEAQDFIANLSASKSFPELGQLAWGEFSQNMGDDWKPTPFEDYVKLFKSRAFEKIFSFLWRNPPFGDAEIKTLRKIRPELMMHIANSKYYLPSE